MQLKPAELLNEFQISMYLHPFSKEMRDNYHYHKTNKNEPFIAVILDKEYPLVSNYLRLEI